MDTFTYKTDAQTKTGVENGLNAGGAAVKSSPTWSDGPLIPTIRACGEPGETSSPLSKAAPRGRGLFATKGFRTNPQRATRIAIAAGVVLTGVAVGMYFLDNAAGKLNNDARLALHTRLLGSAANSKTM